MGSDIFELIGLVWFMTLLFSLLIVLFGRGLFRKAHKDEKTSMYPIVNLFTVLEIANMSTFWGILFFVPFLNVIVFIMMSFKLGKAFNTGTMFSLALVIAPVLFYPILSFNNKQYKLEDEAYFKEMDKIKVDNINLMTDEELKEMSKVDDTDNNVVVDSIFKSDIQMMEQAEPYKAVKIDLLDMEKLKNNDFDKEKDKKKDEDIEIVDL